MAKHTPGPWVIESVHSEALHDVCLGYQVPEAGNPILVASAYDDEFGVINYLEAEANARLIAAAPELLLHLEKAIGLLASCGTVIDFTSDEANEINRAKDSIAKAKGT